MTTSSYLSVRRTQTVSKTERNAKYHSTDFGAHTVLMPMVKTQRHTTKREKNAHKQVLSLQRNCPKNNHTLGKNRESGLSPAQGMGRPSEKNKKCHPAATSSKHGQHDQTPPLSRKRKTHKVCFSSRPNPMKACPDTRPVTQAKLKNRAEC